MIIHRPWWETFPVLIYPSGAAGRRRPCLALAMGKPVPEGWIEPGQAHGRNVCPTCCVSRNPDRLYCAESIDTDNLPLQSHQVVNAPKSSDENGRRPRPRFRNGIKMKKTKTCFGRKASASSKEIME